MTRNEAVNWELRTISEDEVVDGIVALVEDQTPAYFFNSLRS